MKPRTYRDFVNEVNKVMGLGPVKDKPVVSNDADLAKQLKSQKSENANLRDRLKHEMYKNRNKK